MIHAYNKLSAAQQKINPHGMLFSAPYQGKESAHFHLIYNKFMTGIEARDFVISQIAQSDPENKHTVMKLSIELATDLLKLTPREIGTFADKMLDHGVAALKEHGLYGYEIDIDINQDGHVVLFGV